MEKHQLLLAAIAMLVSTTTIFVVVEGALANIVTPDFFNGIRNQASNTCAGKTFYTREAFLQAAASYPSFGNQGSLANSKREVAAFFAHVAQETGSLCYVEEIDRDTYCDLSPPYPCAEGKSYYGRGPLQLSWNYNYKDAGNANNFNGVQDPDIVARDPVIAWKTALWFWMTNVRPVLPKGFGATIRKINGRECNGGNTAAVRVRVSYYNSYCKKFGIPMERRPGC
ncbi:Chitinase 4 [Linum grandiflorum]